MLSVWCPNGCKVFPKYTDAYWALSKHHHGTAGSRRWYYMHSIFVKHCQNNVLQCFTNIIRERATSGPGVRAHGPQSKFRLDSEMRNCGKLMDIWLTPSGVVASQMLLSQQISCISLAVSTTTWIWRPNMTKQT